jgi:hypothetical protein
MPDTNISEIDKNTDESLKKMFTVDKQVVLVTTSGDYTGNINLNLSNVQINRISDLFLKSDIAFLPLYNATVKGEKDKEIIVNIKDIAVVIPKDVLPNPIPELRKDAQVTVKLKFDLGQLSGKVNLMGDSRISDRISDLLNFPGKRWLILYDVTFKGEVLPAVIVNIEFISTVED